MNCTQKAKQECINKEKLLLLQRMLTTKPTKLTLEEKQKLIKQCQEIRDQYENQNIGNLEKVYPLEQNDEDYDKFIEYADLLYQESTGANIKKYIIMIIIQIIKKN